MASLAEPPERPIMRVPFAVAVVARCGELHVRRIVRLVAGFASHALMGADERKCRPLRVIETPMAPAGRVMARFAFRRGAETPLVLTVLVTVCAGRRELQGRWICFFVTALTGQLCVAAGERVICLPCMIECRRAPTLGIVTRLAAGLRAESPLVMNVVVTLLAGLRRLLIRARDMAIRARDRDMAAVQRERELCMVDTDSAPVALAVTAFTARAEFVAMHILLFVAADACRLQLCAERADVAGVTFGLDVAAAQGEPCSVVVEARFLPFPFVVTARALLAVSAVVNVLDSMTGDAARREVLVGLADMACRAGDIPMRVRQGKLGLPVVISLQRRPFVAVVTRLATG